MRRRVARMLRRAARRFDGGSLTVRFVAPGAPSYAPAIKAALHADPIDWTPEDVDAAMEWLDYREDEP